jgi:HEAT repeat protein
MRALSLFLLVSCAAIAQSWQPVVSNARFETRPYSGDLISQVRQVSPAWYGYAVKATPGNRRNCCWDGSQEAGCYLEGNRGTVIIGSQQPKPVELEAPEAIAVLFRVENNEVKKVQVYSTTCPLDAGGLPFVWLTGVPENASLAYLHKLATESVTDHVLDGAILAISQHSSAQADTVLEELTRQARPEKVREKAIFWIGAVRGAAGLSILKNILANDSSDAIREKVLFALSINKQPEALGSLIQAAKTDGSPRIRGQALFWLAQKAGKKASSTIAGALENDPDSGVKKQALFALSQLPQDEGVPKLIEAARTQKSPEVRKQAFFWLGQSRDPRALEFIEQVLVK